MSDLNLEICYLSVSQALEMFKSKTLSPVELLIEIKKRIDHVNPKINAFNFIQFEESLKQAKAAEIKYSQDKEALPLEGIPLAIKDEVDIKGQPSK
jgi:Asp-tRNA(Asn)/Glu-tRNA(Gln) amidotransferase A subunit family amidase